MKRRYSIICTFLLIGMALTTLLGAAEASLEPNHKPVLEIVHPAHAAEVSDLVEIRIGAVDADGNEDIENVFVKIDDGDWQHATYVGEEHDHSWWQLGWNTTSVENGWHDIYARATDGTEHSEDHVIEVKVQNEIHENHPPRVEITSPEMDANVNDPEFSRACAEELLKSLGV